MPRKIPAAVVCEAPFYARITKTKSKTHRTSVTASNPISSHRQRQGSAMRNTSNQSKNANSQLANITPRFLPTSPQPHASYSPRFVKTTTPQHFTIRAARTSSPSLHPRSHPTSQPGDAVERSNRR
jgi:hypothetical protein